MSRGQIANWTDLEHGKLYNYTSSSGRRFTACYKGQLDLEGQAYVHFEQYPGGIIYIEAWHTVEVSERITSRS